MRRNVSPLLVLSLLGLVLLSLSAFPRLVTPSSRPAPVAQPRLAASSRLAKSPATRGDNSQGGVLTQAYSQARTGANTGETILNTSNVNPGQFGKLFSRAVDGFIYAQPLYVSGLAIPRQGVHNV